MNWSDLSSRLDLGYAFLVGLHDNADSFSVHRIRKEDTMSVCPIYDDVNFDHLHSACQVLSLVSYHFPIIINTSIVGKYFESM